MKYDVVAVRRADADVRHITRWTAGRSVQGTLAWLDTYEQLISRPAESADTCAAATEDADGSIPLKEALFRTPRGRTFRAVFTIAGDQVRILRIRGPASRRSRRTNSARCASTSPPTPYAACPATPLHKHQTPSAPICAICGQPPCLRASPLRLCVSAFPRS